MSESSSSLKLSMSVSMFEKACYVIKTKMAGYREQIDAAANCDSSKLYVFIDCDEADDKNDKVRAQLFEAATEFKATGGKIFAMSSRNIHYFSNGDTDEAFTKLYIRESMNAKDKAKYICRVLLKAPQDRIAFCFGYKCLDHLCGNSLIQEGVDVLVDVSGGNKKTQGKGYSIVEYLLLYLSICMHKQSLSTYD